MSAVTRVLAPDGRVLHDCAVAGCETSWDGVTLATMAAPTKAAALPTGTLSPDKTTFTFQATKGV